MWNKIRDFVKGVISELRRVSWTSRKELIGATGAVLLLTLLMSLLVLGLDTLFRLVLRGLLSLAR